MAKAKRQAKSQEKSASSESNPAAEIPTQRRGRRIDLDVIRPIAGVSQILDISVMHFSGGATRPLAGVDVRTLKQEAGVRAQRVQSTPESIVLSVVDFKFDAAEDDKSVCEIHGKVAVAYHFAVPLTEFPPESLDLFAEINAIYNAWPYIRELVGATAARFGLSGVVLPLMKVPETLPPRGEYMTLTSTPISSQESA